MSKREKVDQFLTAYQQLQYENYSDTLFEEFSLQEEQVFWLDTCCSTNQFLKEKSAENPLLPLVCVSDIQEAGVGQHQRSWYSPLGNLHFSMYMPINRHIAEREDFTYIDGRLSLETAIALLGMPMLQALKLNSEVKTGIKWPNDLCTLPRNFNTHSKENSLTGLSKFAGILIEPVHVTVFGSVFDFADENDNQQQTERVRGVIFGVGMNANHTETTEVDGRKITNLQRLLNHTISMPDLAAQTCQACQKALDTYFKHAMSLPIRYFSYDLLYNKQFTIDKMDEHINGVGVGIQEDGALVVATELEENQTIYNGSIVLD